MGAKRRQFVAAGKIGFAVGGQHAFKQLQVLSNAICQPMIGGRGKVNRATGAMLLAQPLQKGLVVGQVLHIQRYRRGDVLLERGFTFGNPARHLDQALRMLTGQRKHGIHKRVRLDQRAIQIHTERYTRPESAGRGGNGGGRQSRVGRRHRLLK